MILTHRYPAMIGLVFAFRKFTLSYISTNLVGQNVFNSNYPISSKVKTSIFAAERLYIPRPTGLYNNKMFRLPQNIDDEFSLHILNWETSAGSKGTAPVGGMRDKAPYQKFVYLTDWIFRLVFHSNFKRFN